MASPTINKKKSYQNNKSIESNENKHILMIAPASIPVTGAEAICNVKLLKVLSENGYKIDLISKK